MLAPFKSTSESTVTKRPAKEWLEIVDQHACGAEQGTWLEELVNDLGTRIPDWDLDEVHSWSDWPDREQHFPGTTANDIGIDNVGVRSDGALVAIQCKARSANLQLSVDDLGAFALVGLDDQWTERWVVSNAQFGPMLRQAIKRSPSRQMRLVDFVAPLRELAHEEQHGVWEDRELTEMQDEVVRSILRQFPEHAAKGRSDWNKGEARGHIVLPCGTGKTRIAYRISKELALDHDGGGGEWLLYSLHPSPWSHRSRKSSRN